MRRAQSLGDAPRGGVKCEVADRANFSLCNPLHGVKRGFIECLLKKLGVFVKNNEGAIEKSHYQQRRSSARRHTTEKKNRAGIGEANGTQVQRHSGPVPGSAARRGRLPDRPLSNRQTQAFELF